MKNSMEQPLPSGVSLNVCLLKDHQPLQIYT
jgi:hypothetical protein